jgi:hypothetical protein
MGIKTIIAGMTFTADHLAAATKGGYQLDAMRRGVVMKLDEAIRDLKMMIGLMQPLDSNVVTLAGMIEVLQ